MKHFSFTTEVIMKANILYCLINLDDTHLLFANGLKLLINFNGKWKHYV